MTAVTEAENHDLAVLSVPTLESEPLTMRPATTLQIGEPAFAVGAPRGLELSLAAGLVSSLRKYEGGVAIQTTTPISPGLSGGGLFDDRGNLIGITTFGVLAEDLNFALPTEWVGSLAGLTPAVTFESEAPVVAEHRTPSRVVGSLGPAPEPQTEREREWARAEAVYRPRMKAAAAYIQQWRVLMRRYYDGCHNRDTIRVIAGQGTTVSTESGGGASIGSTSIYDSDGYYMGSGTTVGTFGWSSVREETDRWSEVTALDNSSTPRCRILASDISVLAPKVEALMEDADREAVRQNIWTWMQRDVPEKLATELW